MKFTALIVILLIGTAYCDSSSSDSDSGSGSSERHNKKLKKYRSKNDCGSDEDCDDPLRLLGDLYKNKYDYKQKALKNVDESSEESKHTSRRRNKNRSGSESSENSGSNSSEGSNRKKSRRRKKSNSSSDDSSDNSGSNSSSGEHKRRKHSRKSSGSDSGSTESNESYHNKRKRPNQRDRYKPKEQVSVSSTEEIYQGNKKNPKDDNRKQPVSDESDEISKSPKYNPTVSYEENIKINKQSPKIDEDLISAEIDEPEIPKKSMLSPIASEEANDHCMKETITTDDGMKIVYPKSNNGALVPGDQVKEILSDPICLDEYNFPITRKCYDVWENISTPECFSYRSKVSNICPPGFKHFNLNEKSYCFVVLPSQKWNHSCMQFGDEIIDFDLFAKESFFNNHKIKKFWLPGKRDGPKDLFISKALSSFGGKINLKHLTINGDCLVFDYKLGKVVSEDCDKQYPMICVQDTTNQLIKQACPDGFHTTKLIGYQNKCFRISSEVNNNNIFQVSSPEKEYILRSIIQPSGDLKIAINVLPNNPMSIPQIFESNKNLTFSNWIQRYKVDHVDKFVVTEFQEEGWFLSEKYDLIANEIELKMQKPEMYLNFQLEGKTLYLTVYSGNFLWKSNDGETGIQCFTNSDGNIIKKVGINIKSIDQDQFRTISIYEVDLIHKNPGEYWCHGHSISNFEFIKTDKVVAYREPNDLIFVALIEIKCGICTQVTDNDFIKNITNSIQNTIDKTVRIMKIDSINFEESTVRYVLHITTTHHDLSTKEINHAYKKGISLKTYEIYLLRKSLLKKLNKLTDYSLYSLTSSNWCFSEEEKYNVIETIDEDSKLQEICKSSFYSQMKECINDFMYGGIWKDIVCSLKKKDITQELNGLKISYFHASHKIRKLLKIISDDVKIKPTDLYIIADILKSIQVADLKLTDIKNVVKILNEIMLIKKLSEVKYNTTNIILDTFDKIVNELNSYHMKTPKVEVFTINENSGVLGIAIFKNTSKEIINNDLSDYYFEYLYSDEQTEILLLEDNFEVAAIIPSELLTIINANNKISTAPLKIVVSLFYGNLLFQTNENVDQTKSSGIVLKLSIPGYDLESIKQLNQIISVYFKIKNDLQNKKVSCGFWNFDDWASGELIYVSDKNVAKCEYSDIRYFSLLSAEQIFQYDVRSSTHTQDIEIVD